MPAKGRPFKKGESGNKQGSSRLAKIKGKLTGLPLEEVLLHGRILMEDTDPGVCHRVISAPDSPLALRLLATMADEALTNQAVPAFNAIFDRVYGKAKETVNVGGQEGGSPIKVDLMTTEEKLERLAQLRAAREQVAK